MAYQNIESRIETALKTPIAAAIAADVTLTGYSICLRTWWNDDDGSAADSFTLPLVGIQAGPNVPYGYRGVKRRVPVTITVATAQPDDRDKAALKNIYDAIRKILDEDTITNADLTAIAIEITDGGEIIADEDVNIVTIALNAQIDATPTA